MAYSDLIMIALRNRRLDFVVNCSQVLTTLLTKHSLSIWYI